MCGAGMKYVPAFRCPWQLGEGVGSLKDEVTSECDLLAVSSGNL